MKRDLIRFLRAINWIKKQLKHVKIRYKLKIEEYYEKDDELLTNFIKYKKIAELEAHHCETNYFTEKDFNRIRSLKIIWNCLEKFDIKMFKRLQILGIKVNLRDFHIVIHFLASKFSKD